MQLLEHTPISPKTSPLEQALDTLRQEAISLRNDSKLAKTIVTQYMLHHHAFTTESDLETMKEIITKDILRVNPTIKTPHRFFYSISHYEKINDEIQHSLKDFNPGVSHDNRVDKHS